jgi:hypothetical protein
VSILSKVKPIHALSNCLLQMHINIILVSKPRSSKCFFPSGFLLKACTGLPPSPPPALYVPHARPFYFYFVLSLEYYFMRSQIMKIFDVQLSHVRSLLLPLRPKYLPQHLILENLDPKFFLQCERGRFMAIQNYRQNYTSLCFDFYTLILDNKRQDE